MARLATAVCRLGNSKPPSSEKGAPCEKFLRAAAPCRGGRSKLLSPVAVKPTPLYERWLDKVEKTDTCWLWRGAIKNGGYGVVNRGARGEGVVRAHVFAYSWFRGPVPAGMDVRHLCHVPNCVRPDHLELGTRRQNMADSMRAGRRLGPRRPPQGERNANSKLTVADVLAIRADSRLLREVAADYGVTMSTISSIRRGSSWQHVTAPSP